METFGERVKRLRLALGLTQAQLARRAGFAHQSAIGNIEAGKRDGSRNVAKLAAALCVDPAYLETGKGDPHQASVEVAEIIRIYESLPPEDKARAFRVFMAAVGPAVPDHVVEDKMPITRRSIRNT